MGSFYDDDDASAKREVVSVRMPVADIDAIVTAIRCRQGRSRTPHVVALDGRSGAGKSTHARNLAGPLGAAVVEGDGFFTGGIAVRGDEPADRVRDCIDWRAQRPVLDGLRRRLEVSYHAFDWARFDGSRESALTRVAPCHVILLEGVYSARPELGDLVDTRVVVVASHPTRRRRLLEREGPIGPWWQQWHEAEDWYFSRIAPLSGFDLVVDAD
jgi:hypothetical protein